MKMVVLIVVPIALIALLGEFFFAAPDHEIAHYEQRFAKNADSFVTAEQRQMIYYILRDRPTRLGDQWTASETDTLTHIFTRLANDFPPASPPGRMYLVSELGEAAPDFPVLRGQAESFRDENGDIYVRPSNGLGLLFDLLDAEK